jgi:hypothetical protein
LLAFAVDYRLDRQARSLDCRGLQLQLTSHTLPF